MIKTSLKTFAKNLIYVFVAMGIVYLFMLLAVALFASLSIKNVGSTITQVATLIGDASAQSSASVNEFLSYAFGQINWNGEFLATLKQVLDTNWILETIKGFFATLSASTEGFEQQITDAITTFKNTFTADLTVTITICAVGITAANFATRFVLRRKNARRNFKQFVVAHTLVPLFESAMMIVFTIVLPIVKLYGILLAVAMLVLTAIFSLTAAYIVRKKDGLKLKDVLTASNLRQYTAAIIILFAINALLAALLALINIVLCILLMIPIVIYTIGVADVSTDAFVSSLQGADCCASTDAASLPHDGEDKHIADPDVPQQASDDGENDEKADEAHDENIDDACNIKNDDSQGDCHNHDCNIENDDGNETKPVSACDGENDDGQGDCSDDASKMETPAND